MMYMLLQRRVWIIRKLFFMMLCCGLVISGLCGLVFAKTIKAQKINLQYRKKALNYLDAFALYIEHDNKLIGKLGQPRLDIDYRHLKTMNVHFVENKLSVDATTVAGEIFKEILIESKAILHAFSFVEGGRLDVDLSFSEISNIAFSPVAPVTKKTADPGSIMGKFTWQDNSSLDLMVWNRRKNSLSSSTIGGGSPRVELAGSLVTPMARYQIHKKASIFEPHDHGDSTVKRGIGNG